MHGVVSLLDDSHYARVEGIWEELAKKFDVRGIYVTPFPHFSYQVAEEYDADAVERSLQELAATMRPFRIHTAGLGIFTVASPVLYVSVVRSPELSRLHEEVWRAVSPIRPGAVTRYYSPDMWMPHITLAHGDIEQDKLAEIVRVLSGRTFHWEMTVCNLSMIYDTGTEQGLRCRFNFKGKPRAAC
ncbi:MAG: 2'-5' RNA ligase family protein [Acidobacteria bacterium]|nr:2'-5' RNA ligase family protein [Acidobacteriota bacterium]